MLITDVDKFVKSPMISVVVTTYNHEHYITECLESILHQNCNIPFEVIIGDDASTDSTTSICIQYQKKYPKQISCILQEHNKGHLNNYADCLELCRGKYIAQCAGDDYWCDISKLQKQYDCLENRDGYGLVSTSGWRLQNGIMFPARLDMFCEEGDVRVLRSYGSLEFASSIFFERQLLQYVDIRSWKELGIIMEDYVMQAIFAHHTKFAHISDKCVVYRILSNSVSNSTSFDKRVEIALSKINVQRYLKTLYSQELTEVWSDDLLNDMSVYLKLRQAIYHGRGGYLEAKRLKMFLRTSTYKKKWYCKCLRGKLSFVLLTIGMRIQVWYKQ